MEILKALDPATTTGKSKDLFNAVQNKLGMVPNMMRTMGNSPAVLEGYLAFNTALAGSSIGAKLGELISLTIANVNRCEYCNSAHTLIAEKLVHINSSEVDAARHGQSADPKIQAALQFSKILVKQNGQTTAADIDALKVAGFDDAGIAEIIAHVALNIFTNYFNNAVQVVVDFPKVELV